MATGTDATTAQREALAGLLAMLLAPAGRSAEELTRRLAALDAFTRLGLDPAHFAARLEEAVARQDGQLGDHSWLPDGDRARLDRLMAPIVDASARVRLCEVAAAVLGDDDSVAHSRCQALDHVVSCWHVELPHHAAQGTRG